MDHFPIERIVPLNKAPMNPDGEFVLYWMIAFRRGEWNFSLERAAGWAQELRKPLLVLEALRCDYPWASDRLHSFMLEGMLHNQAHFRHTPALYFPFVERFKNEGKGLIAELASRSCIIITDEYPSFFLPRMTRSAAEHLPIRVEAVDSNGLLPMGITDRVFLTAYSFRRFIQQQLPRHLDQFPKKDPLSNSSIPRMEELPGETSKKWPMTTLETANLSPGFLSGLPIDHTVKPVETGEDLGRRELS